MIYALIYGLSSYKAEKFMKEFEIWNISRKPKQSGLLLNSCDVYGISHGWENYDFLSAKYLNCDESESKLAEICWLLKRSLSGSS